MAIWEMGPIMGKIPFGNGAHYGGRTVLSDPPNGPHNGAHYGSRTCFYYGTHKAFPFQSRAKQSTYETATSIKIEFTRSTDKQKSLLGI